MNHIENKVEWCLKKAERELEESSEHRGLIKVKPNLEKAKENIRKAEHYLRATHYLKKGNFSDVSASTVFYSMYHCLLSIAIKFGYESRNQECTFALIYNLIKENKIEFEEKVLNKIASLDIKEDTEGTSTGIREKYQYGTELSIKENIYNIFIELAKEVLLETKEIIEK